MPDFAPIHVIGSLEETEIFTTTYPNRRASRGWGSRYLNRFKTVGKKRYQLHATRGWKCIGAAK